MLRLVLPKGSLEKATLELFEAADLPVRRSSTVDYQATIDDPRIESVRILRPQEIPMYVAEGLFDIGITGRDWVEETGSVVETPRRAEVLEGDEQPDQAGRGGRRRQPGRIGRRPARRRAGPVGVSRADEAILRRSWHRRRRSAVVRSDRGEDPRHRRLRRRDHRDRAGTARRRPAR